MTILRSRRRSAIARMGLAATAAALLFAMAEPGVAARKSRKQPDNGPAQQSDKRAPVYDPQGTSRSPFGPGRNLPYPDRPYGDPGRF